jgi:hypothetical protein
MAGRYSHSLHGGFVHGILVWSITLILTFTFASIGTGAILGGAVKVLGQGAAVAGQVAVGAGQVAQDAAKRSETQTGSFIDEAVQSMPADSPKEATTRAKREIGFAVTRLFAPGNDVNSTENRRAVIQSLTHAGMSEPDATKTVDAWIASYRDLQTELAAIKAKAEEKARVAAEEAASHLSAAALWAFVGLLLGLLVTALGGSVGARSAVHHHAGVY